jgi:hypothetical protein
VSGSADENTLHNFRKGKLEKHLKGTNQQLHYQVPKE